MPCKPKKQRQWMHANKPEMAKEWEKEEAQQGGTLNGPSHEEGGIPVLAEGGEVIVNDSINSPIRCSHIITSNSIIS